jgi:hypothetical protein
MERSLRPAGYGARPKDEPWEAKAELLTSSDSRRWPPTWILSKRTVDTTAGDLRHEQCNDCCR